MNHSHVSRFCPVLSIVQALVREEEDGIFTSSTLREPALGRAKGQGHHGEKRRKALNVQLPIRSFNWLDVIFIAF
jgi:hypothetical protein